jgi:hypothetical protein
LVLDTQPLCAGNLKRARPIGWDFQFFFHKHPGANPVPNGIAPDPFLLLAQRRTRPLLDSRVQGREGIQIGWVKGKIAELWDAGGIWREWSRKLTRAGQKGKLFGIATETPWDESGLEAGETKVAKTWTYRL